MRVTYVLENHSNNHHSVVPLIPRDRSVQTGLEVLGSNGEQLVLLDSVVSRNCLQVSVLDRYSELDETLKRKWPGLRRAIQNRIPRSAVEKCFGSTTDLVPRNKRLRTKAEVSRDLQHLSDELWATLLSIDSMIESGLARDPGRGSEASLRQAERIVRELLWFFGLRKWGYIPFVLLENPVPPNSFVLIQHVYHRESGFERKTVLGKVWTALSGRAKIPLKFPTYHSCRSYHMLVRPSEGAVLDPDHGAVPKNIPRNAFESDHDYGQHAKFSEGVFHIYRRGKWILDYILGAEKAARVIAREDLRIEVRVKEPLAFKLLLLGGMGTSLFTGLTLGLDPEGYTGYSTEAFGATALAVITLVIHSGENRFSDQLLAHRLFLLVGAFLLGLILRFLLFGSGWNP